MATTTSDDDSQNSSQEHIFTYDFQRGLIKMLASNVTFTANYGSLVEDSYFETHPLRLLSDIVKKFVYTYDKEMDRTALMVEIDNYCVQMSMSDEQAKNIQLEAKTVMDIHIQSEQFYIDNLVRFVRRQKLKNAILQSVEILEKDGSYESVLQMIDTAVSVGSGTNPELSFDDLKTTPQWYMKKYDPQKLIKTGFPTLDKALGGGMAPGEVHVILAPPKVGKSSLMVNTGVANIKDGKSVFHISLEIAKEDVAMKYAMNLSHMTREQMIKMPIEAFEFKMKKYDSMKPHLYINFWPEGSTNTMTIRSWISRVRSKTGVSPDLLIIDYDDPLRQNTKIQLLDGTEVEIKDLVDKKEFWLYACKEDGTVVPGRGHSVRIARHVDELIKITLDNGKVVESTVNHNHMMRDGTFKRADQFEVGDSMMPLYLREDLKSPCNKYTEVLDNKTGTYKSVHRMVFAHENPSVQITGMDVHHINNVSYDNRPENLRVLTKAEHLAEHWKTPSFYKAITDKANSQWKDPNFRDRIIENSRSEIVKPRECQYCKQIFNTTTGGLVSHTKECTSKPPIVKQDFTCRVCNNVINTTKATFKTHETRCKRKSLGLGIMGKPKLTKEEFKEKVGNLNKSELHKSKVRSGLSGEINTTKEWSCKVCNSSMVLTRHEFMKHKYTCFKEHNIPINHKVVKVERVQLDEPEPVYCLTVDKYHNYALSAGIFTHNCLAPTSGKSKDDMYGDAGQVYTDLIQLASYFNCPILTAAQPQRDAWENANDGKLITHDKLAHSAKKAHKCWSISSLNFANDQPNGILYLDINRRGDSKVKVKIQKELDKCIMQEI